MHMEDLLDETTYATFRPRVEDEWQERFAKKEHDMLSVTPTYLSAEASEGVEKRCHVGDVARGRVSLAELQQDGEAFLKRYLKDAQAVFSRVQHHVHLRTKKGYQPLRACQSKASKRTGECKASFPMTRLKVPKTLLVCRGIAKKMNLRVAGRRNAFATFLGRRRCEWQSGTTPSFAVLFRSNTHMKPNYRMPILPETHEDDACPSLACAARVREVSETKGVSKLAQRAQREATGYYCGYTFKAQPTGKRYLKGAAESLNYLTTGLDDKSVSKQWHRISHRVLTLSLIHI